MDIKLCFTSEAARILRCNEQTARQWADSGKVSVVRTAGGVRLFDRAELERLAADRAVKAG
jgi:excisionase family DNA binding protein